MPETVSLTLELPKELVARVKAVKPSWLIELTDEEYLGHVVARGNFDDYLQQLENASFPQCVGGHRGGVAAHQNHGQSGAQAVKFPRHFQAEHRLARRESF